MPLNKYRLQFSIPKNIRYFKVLFPSNMFAKFVDISEVKQQTATLKAIVDEFMHLSVYKYDPGIRVGGV